MNSTTGGAKLRILLIDDHRGVLNTLASVLAGEFDVVGVATDGREAVTLAGQLKPDLIVLDINMPGLDGYQTKDALDRAGSRVPVVFLSMFDSEEYVSKAFRCGGRGYVLKPRVAHDLATALHQARLGGRFAPSLASLFHLANGGGH